MCNMTPLAGFAALWVFLETGFLALAGLGFCDLFFDIDLKFIFEFAVPFCCLHLDDMS